MSNRKKGISEMVHGSFLRLVDGHIFNVSHEVDLIKEGLRDVDSSKFKQAYDSNANDYLKSVCLNTDIVVYSENKESHNHLPTFWTLAI
jgi:hypothetical protein